MKYKECLDYLNRTARFAKKTSLDNIKYLLECLGNPQYDLCLVHVAGTNGKGSVCAFLESMLLEKGKTTGVFSSPHILSMNERIRLNRENISQQDFENVFKKVYTVVQKALKEGFVHPSFFEFLFLMAMVSFQEKQPDVCIIETGMGGRYDATNLIMPKLCILTTISLDHMEFLGTTLKEIALHKAGIIKEEVPVLCTRQKKEVFDVIKQEATKKGAPLIEVSEDNLNFHEKDGKYIDFLSVNAYDRRRVWGSFQKENLSLALEAEKILDGPISAFDIRSALEKVVLPGRMEEIAPSVFADVAHNIQGIEAFCETVKKQFPGKKRILFAASHKNEEETMRQMLERIPGVEKIYHIQISGRNVDIEQFQDAFDQMMMYKEDDTACFVAGSFYLVGTAKQYISQEEVEKC